MLRIARQLIEIVFSRVKIERDAGRSDLATDLQRKTTELRCSVTGIEYYVTDETSICT